MKKHILLLCLLAAACDSPTVPERFLRDVYDFRLLTPEPLTFRWPTGATVNFMVIADTDAARTDFMRAAVSHAVAVWNNAALYGEVELAETSSIESADVLVMYSQSSAPVDLSACIPSGGLAFTTFCLTDDGFSLEPFARTDGGASRVKFVITVRPTSGTDAIAVRRLVTHEIGHVLGIAQHSPKQTDLMFAGTLQRDDPSPADRATLQVLYHTVPDITP